MNKKDISYEDAKLFLKYKLKQSPLEGNNKYYIVSISLPIEKTSSLTGFFVVMAEDDNQAYEKCIEYSLIMKEIDDLKDIIKWEFKPSNNIDNMDNCKFTIFAGPINEEGYLDYYSKESWDGFVKSKYYSTTGSNFSFISEWKWPIIFIPLIIWMLYFLNSILK